MGHAPGHGEGTDVILVGPVGKEGRRLPVAQWPELQRSRVASVGRAGQHVLHEEANVAAAQDEVDRQGSHIARPPALQLAGEGGIRLRRVLVLVQDHQQRTLPSEPREGCQRLAPVGERRGAQHRIVRAGEDRRRQVAQLIAGGALDGLVDDGARAAGEAIQERGLPHPAPSEQDAELGASLGPALAEPCQLRLAIDELLHGLLSP